MKKLICGAILTILAAATVLLCACDAEEMGPLKDVSRPYTGVYACETLTLGGKDMTEKFEKLTLELKQDGTFTLSYVTATGGEGSYGGRYAIDTEKGEITFSADRVRGAYTFPYEKGVVRIDRNLYGYLLHAEFRMP